MIIHGDRVGRFVHRTEQYKVQGFDPERGGMGTCGQVCRVQVGHVRVYAHRRTMHPNPVETVRWSHRKGASSACWV